MLNRCLVATRETIDLADWAMLVVVALCGAVAACRGSCCLHEREKLSMQALRSSHDSRSSHKIYQKQKRQTEVRGEATCTREHYSVPIRTVECCGAFYPYPKRNELRRQIFMVAPRHVGQPRQALRHSATRSCHLGNSQIPARWGLESSCRKLPGAQR